MSPLRDDEAFWLLDGKATKPKPRAKPSSPLSFAEAVRVDDGLETIGLYVTTCGVCGEDSPPRSQALLHEWRHAHELQHGGAA